MRKIRKGIFSPIPTPFEDGRFAPRRLIQNLTRWRETKLAGHVILGSNGEAALLQESEKLEIVRVARQEIEPEKLMIVGTGLESTEATKVLTLRVADLGADAALVLTPFYYQPMLSKAGILQHYVSIADASPIPILLYNMPKLTHFNLPVDWVVELAQHPNVIGMKDSAGNLAQLLELQEKTPSEFQVLLGNDTVLLGGLVHGVPGAILALGNIAPEVCVALFDAVQEQRWQEARNLAERLAPVGRVVISKHGIPGLKAALDLLGYYGGEPRPPLLPLDERGKSEIRAALHAAGLL